MKVIKTERGWGGHFICAHQCLFRRNTLLQCGDSRIVVSTVGNKLLPGSKTHERDTIGFCRYYETMAFWAVKDGEYWEADTQNRVYFDSEWQIDHLDENSDIEANSMHEMVVLELTKKLEAEELIQVTASPAEQEQPAGQ